MSPALAIGQIPLEGGHGPMGHDHGPAAAETVMTERLAAFKKAKAAALPLYAAFSAEQKATADELMPVMGMGMGM